MSNRIINTNFWKDDYIADLDPIEKLLFNYLFTNPQTNIAGVYEINLREIAFDTGIDRDMVVKILGRFQDDGKLLRIDSWIILQNAVRHQSKNPSVISGIRRIYDSLPDYVRDAVGAVWYRGKIDRLLGDWVQPVDSLGTESGILNLTKLNTKKHGAKNAPATKKPGKSKKPDSIVAKLYYEAIKALDVPVRNHNNVYDKIRELEKEPDQKKVVNYLTFMRDDYPSLVMERKPHINEALDIYAKRQQIRNLLELERRQKAGARYE